MKELIEDPIFNKITAATLSNQKILKIKLRENPCYVMARIWFY